MPPGPTIAAPGMAKKPGPHPTSARVSPSLSPSERRSPSGVKSPRRSLRRSFSIWAGLNLCTRLKPPGPHNHREDDYQERYQQVAPPEYAGYLREGRRIARLGAYPEVVEKRA